MIGKLTGKVDSFGEDWAILDVAGVGYLVHCSARTLAQLAQVGAPATLAIETYVREDAIKLYGFASPLEKEWFNHLQTVQGVGARVALAVLDVLSPSELEQAVILGDKAAIARAAGVGPKLAGRIVAELKDRPAPKPILQTAGGAPAHAAYTHPFSDAETGTDRREGLQDILLRNDAVSALVNLGYAEPRAVSAVAAAYAKFEDDPPVDVLIKTALKEVG